MKKTLTLLLGMLLLYSCSTSSDGSTTTATAVPAPPENLTGEATSTTAINLIWTDRSTNETGFNIERKKGTDSFSIVGTTATDIATFSDTGLTPGNTYIYRVYSYNAAGKSPVYSNELTLTINIPSITIGIHTWTTQNLDVATYNDGTPIPQVNDPAVWDKLTTGAWCYYNNDSVTGTTYGKLYNWYAVAGIWNDASKTDPTQRKKLAPTGYHVPSGTQWATLTTYLGGENIAGGKMKETGIAHWLNPNTAATNTSGFTGLPGGYRSYDGTFNFIGLMGSWWSSSEDNTSSAWNLDMYWATSSGSRVSNDKTYGFSVRCLRD